jgi:hypothetical protein
MFKLQPRPLIRGRLFPAGEERKRADVARARRRWIREQGWLDTTRLVFIDETAVTTNMVRLNGWSPCGEIRSPSSSYLTAEHSEHTHSWPGRHRRGRELHRQCPCDGTCFTYHRSPDSIRIKWCACSERPSRTDLRSDPQLHGVRIILRSRFGCRWSDAPSPYRTNLSAKFHDGLRRQDRNSDYSRRATLSPISTRRRKCSATRRRAQAKSRL